MKVVEEDWPVQSGGEANITVFQHTFCSAGFPFSEIGIGLSGHKKDLGSLSF